MEFKTELNPGDKLFAMYHDKVQDFLIEEVSINCTLDYNTMKPHNLIHIKYKLRVGMSAGYRIEMYQSEVGRKYFKSKEELVASL